MHMDNVAAPVWEETSDQISPRTGEYDRDESVYASRSDCC